MPSKTGEKIECLNPNTGNKMNIDAKVYEIFSSAIYHVLMDNKQGVTYTEIVKGVKECFKKQKTAFSGSVEWYAVTVKHDMVAKGIIESFTEKGKKLHKLSPLRRTR